MGRVGVKELKNRLTQYLRRAKQGEEIVVTERGNPIVLMQPLQSVERLESLDGRLARLAIQGKVSLPTRPRLKRIRMAKVRGKLVSRTILEDRR
jgi:prevent-host-death family protein